MEDGAIITGAVTGLAWLVREIVPIVMRWNKSTSKEKRIDDEMLYDQVMQTQKRISGDLSKSQTNLEGMTAKYITCAINAAKAEAALEASEGREAILKDEIAELKKKLNAAKGASG